MRQYKIKTPPVRKTAKIGSLIDYYYTLREEKKELKAAVSVVDKKMKEIENAAIDKLKKQGVKSSKALEAIGTITNKETYVVDEWDDFYAYAKRKGNEDLLQHSCASAAVKAREEEGKKVPGVRKNVYTYLSVRKL